MANRSWARESTTAESRAESRAGLRGGGSLRRRDAAAAAVCGGSLRRRGCGRVAAGLRFGCGGGVAVGCGGWRTARLRIFEGHEGGVDVGALLGAARVVLVSVDALLRARQVD